MVKKFFMRPRENWGSRLGFLLATAGSAVGLGALWKFPYVAGENGGGAFVLTYLILTFVIGVPIFIGELMLGRATAKSPVGAFADLAKEDSRWRIVGWIILFAPVLILSFYSVVAGWALNYTFMSLLNFTKGRASSEISEIFTVVHDSADINLFFTLFFIALTTGVLYKGVRKGIEFWSKLLMPSLFILLLLLFFYSMTLDGFQQALHFIFRPNFRELTPAGLLEALGMACFTLSVGMGVLITYGSYMRKEDDIPKTAIMIAIVNIAVSLLAALMIFPIIFTFNFAPAEGPGLLFKTLPVLFARLPGTLLLSTFFFLLVVFAALTSTISIMEVPVAVITDVYRLSRGKTVLLIGLSVFILSIPSALAGSGVLFGNWVLVYGKNFFGTMDGLAFSWILPINALLTSLFVGWFLNRERANQEFTEGSSLASTYPAWFFLIRYIVPLAVLIIILEQGGLIDFGI